MGIIGWIVFGLVVGLLARAIMPGKDSMGLIATTLLGIIGAVATGYLGVALDLYDRESGAGLIAATVGALVVLAIYNRVTSRRRRIRPPTDVDRHDRFAA